MLTDSYSVSLAHRFSVPETYHHALRHCQSRLFTVSSTSNPVVAAAGPLLSLMERLCMSPSLPSISVIQENIEHEICAFHSRLSGQEYAKEFIIIGKYLLTVTMDELLSKNFYRVHGYFAEFKALTPSSQGDIGPEQRFFDIVNYMKDRTSQYLDLVELAYYCLIAGFEGQYHMRADGKLALENITEELFNLIQKNRAHKPHRLFHKKSPDIPEFKPRKSYITGALLSLGILTILYLFSHTLLEYKAKSLLGEHSELVRLIDQ